MQTKGSFGWHYLVDCTCGGAFGMDILGTTCILELALSKNLLPIALMVRAALLQHKPNDSMQAARGFGAPVLFDQMLFPFDEFLQLETRPNWYIARTAR